MSGEARVRVAPLLSRDASMANPVPPWSSSSDSTTRSTTARGGASVLSRRENSTTAAGSPSTSITTPVSVLPIEPLNDRSAAVT